MTTDDNMLIKKVSLFVPKNAHLKPSIIPTIGFSEYSILHFWGTTSLLNPTGEIYKPNWIIKGTIY